MGNQTDRSAVYRANQRKLGYKSFSVMLPPNIMQRIHELRTTHKATNLEILEKAIDCLTNTEQHDETLHYNDTHIDSQHSDQHMQHIIDELSIKNKQIEDQSRQIERLLTHNEQSNILMGQLNQIINNFQTQHQLEQKPFEKDEEPISESKKKSKKGKKKDAKRSKPLKSKKTKKRKNRKKR